MNPGRLLRRGTARGHRPRTLRGRLALVALATTAVWVTLLTVAFNLVLAGRMRAQADDLLRTRATAVAATLDVHPDGRITVREPGDDQALDVGVWIYRGSRALERPSAPAPLQRGADALAGRSKVFQDVTDPQDTRLYALPVTGAGGRQVGTVVASVDLDPYQDTARWLLAGSTGLALALPGGVYLVTRTVVGRALRPVGAMSAQAAEWSEHGAEGRFGEQGRPAELAGLAGNLDALLDRLAAVLRHERQLSADLSHELRTPLARITAETDWLTARPRAADEQRASLEAIAGGAAAMRQICEALLTDARAGAVRGGGAVPGRCSPAGVARALAARGAADRPDAPRITVGGSGATAGVSAAVAERILAPLLDNALRYAARAVAVHCAAEHGVLRILVEDDGPGVPRDLGAAAFDAGRRGDPADGHDGAGLGLPLARRLARAAGGDITLDDTPGALGGARFVVTLPKG